MKYYTHKRHPTSPFGVDADPENSETGGEPCLMARNDAGEWFYQTPTRLIPDAGTLHPSADVWDRAVLFGSWVEVPLTVLIPEQTKHIPVYQGSASSRENAESMATHTSALGERTGGITGIFDTWSHYRNTGRERVYFEWLETFEQATGEGLPAITLPCNFQFYTKP